VNYASPAIDDRQSIADAFVLGVTYITPTWADQPDQRDQDR
jgi:hypothetical protein